MRMVWGCLVSVQLSAGVAVAGGPGLTCGSPAAGCEDKAKLGRHRWVVERTISWLLRFKRLAPVL